MLILRRQTKTKMTAKKMQLHKIKEGRGTMRAVRKVDLRRASRAKNQNCKDKCSNSNLPGKDSSNSNSRTIHRMMMMRMCIRMKMRTHNNSNNNNSNNRENRLPKSTFKETKSKCKHRYRRPCKRRFRIIMSMPLPKKYQVW